MTITVDENGNVKGTLALGQRKTTNHNNESVVGEAVMCFDGCTLTELAQWAASSRFITWQATLKNVPKAGMIEAYKQPIMAKSAGTRTKSEAEHAAEMVAKMKAKGMDLDAIMDLLKAAVSK